MAEDGQLALSHLAASAAHGFMPKIQTQGQLGQARWRLVSAPSIPGAHTRAMQTQKIPTPALFRCMLVPRCMALGSQAQGWSESAGWCFLSGMRAPGAT